MTKFIYGFLISLSLCGFATPSKKTVLTNALTALFYGDKDLASQLSSSNSSLDDFLKVTSAKQLAHLATNLLTLRDALLDLGPHELEAFTTDLATRRKTPSDSIYDYDYSTLTARRYLLKAFFKRRIIHALGLSMSVNSLTMNDPFFCTTLRRLAKHDPGKFAGVLQMIRTPGTRELIGAGYYTSMHWLLSDSIFFDAQTIALDSPLITEAREKRVPAIELVKRDYWQPSPATRVPPEKITIATVSELVGSLRYTEAAFVLSVILRQKMDASPRNQARIARLQSLITSHATQLSSQSSTNSSSALITNYIEVLNGLSTGLNDIMNKISCQSRLAEVAK